MSEKKNVYYSLEDLLSRISDRIKEETDKQLNDFINRGAHNCGQAALGYIKKAADTFEQEIINLLTKIAETNPDIKEWEDIKKKVIRFADTIKSWINDECKGKWSKIKETIENETDTAINHVIHEINIFIDGKISSLKKEKSKSYTALLWDILKILIATVLGYLIGKYKY